MTTSWEKAVDCWFYRRLSGHSLLDATDIGHLKKCHLTQEKLKNTLQNSKKKLLIKNFLERGFGYIFGLMKHLNY